MSSASVRRGAGMDAPIACLLLVDDDVDARLMQRSLGTIPELTCERVDSIAAARDALPLLRQQCAGRVLLLIDLNLPGSSSVEALRALSVEQSVAALVFLAADDRRVRQRAFENGASACFIKPRESAGFRSLLTTILAYWRQGFFPTFG